MININQFSSHLDSERTRAFLICLYGDNPDEISFQQQRWNRLAGLYRENFPGQESVRMFSTPGRTEVGGNHTDHQHGRVLCAAVDLDIIALAAPMEEPVIRLLSEGFDQMDVVDLGQLDPLPEEKGTSAALIRGIAAGFNQRGIKVGGMNICTTSRVPQGSGLSSSAAFEIIVATIMDHLYGKNSLSPLDRAIISQAAENNYFGKPSGLMDQCGCSIGGFIALDFQLPDKPQVDSIPLDFAHSGHSLVITNTGGSHADLADDYASIPEDMKRVAEFMGYKVLRQVNEQDFWQKLPQMRGRIDDRALLRAMHFFADNERVAVQAEHLRQGHFTSFLELVRQSGLSSWTLLQNITSPQRPSEQSLALGLAASEKILQGKGACRVHGGGFAGTIQAFVPNELLAKYLATMNHLFGAQAAAVMKVRPYGSVEIE